MNSEKVKEIKEKLQEEIFIANSFGDKLRKVPTKELENLLTLINELESENESLKINMHETENLNFQINQMNGDLILENQALKDRLAELEKKIENGTLVELPCKVGDTVYWVMDMNIFTYKVKGFSYNCNDDMGLRLILQEIEPSVSFYLGKRLFFTKTEAEARLKELQEKQK